MNKFIIVLISFLVFINHTIINAFAITKSDAQDLHPESYQLNALDPKKLAQCYQDNLGMVILNQDDQVIQLGNSGGDLLLEIF